MNFKALSGSQFEADVYSISTVVERFQKSVLSAIDWPSHIMDDRTIDSIFLGSLESLPPVSSKIVRIFTSSTFTGVFKTKQKIYSLHV